MPSPSVYVHYGRRVASERHSPALAIAGPLTPDRPFRFPAPPQGENAAHRRTHRGEDRRELIGIKQVG